MMLLWDVNSCAVKYPYGFIQWSYEVMGNWSDPQKVSIAMDVGELSLQPQRV
ncbi:hypothetical protein MPLA_1350006 [Mesorhizobium sp. ORS 3359]|nr:hypothetical protein MPLA_1350006 [Mesorhizobium sp. ORS 3359]